MYKLIIFTFFEKKFCTFFTKVKIFRILIIFYSPSIKMFKKKEEFFLIFDNVFFMCYSEVSKENINSLIGLTWGLVCGKSHWLMMSPTLEKPYLQ